MERFVPWQMSPISAASKSPPGAHRRRLGIRIGHRLGDLVRRDDVGAVGAGVIVDDRIDDVARRAADRGREVAVVTACAVVDVELRFVPLGRRITKTSLFVGTYPELTITVWRLDWKVDSVTLPVAPVPMSIRLPAEPAPMPYSDIRVKKAGLFESLIQSLLCVVASATCAACVQ